MVGEEGLEPSRAEAHKILSLARLPIPPLALAIIIAQLSHVDQPSCIRDIIIL